MDKVGEEVIQVPNSITISSAPSHISACNKTSISVQYSPHLLPTQFKDTVNNTDVVVNSPQDSWLSITASRNGNAYYSAFHTLCSGIGFQALALPVAFATLGWTWGIICLSMVFAWQFYTIWLLVQLHEAVPGKRYDRFLGLSMAAFGEKLGKLLALFPTMYLSGAACVMLIMTAADSMELFMKVTSESTTKSQPLTTIECYLLFVCLATILALLLPNLNSAAWISFIGASAAVSYCTLIWAISVSKSRPDGISYDPVTPKSDIGSTFGVFNALGIIALAFRGHNLILEIQATMPSSEKKPSRVPMWRGVNFAYLLIALCLYPLAIAGYWSYGDTIQTHKGLLKALHAVHKLDTSKFLLKLTTLLVVIHCLCSFQIYAMPTFDNWEFAYTSKKKKPCAKWIRSAFRVTFGCLTFFIAVAIPFLRGLAGLIGGIALPVTFVYPCIMWIVMKKPQPWSVMWCTNLVLGSLGVALSVIVFAGGVWSLVNPGLDVRFFKP